MPPVDPFVAEIETKVFQQLKAKRVGYLLGAGSSYLDGNGYPLAMELWDKIKANIDEQMRDVIQAKLDGGANGLECALDLLDPGEASDTPYRHLVTEALAQLFRTMAPRLETHCAFIKGVARKRERSPIFSLNYDPLIERAADQACVRVIDGFFGADNAFFDPLLFQEITGKITGTYKTRSFELTAFPVRLIKLHGSLGWHEIQANDVRRCPFHQALPPGARRLMIPPQRRKASDTMNQPYSALWTIFRGCLGQDRDCLNRLASIGYGLADNHVNDILESALGSPNFTLLVFAKSLSSQAWERWSVKPNVIIVTQGRCSLKGRIGPGHPDLWSFERLSREV